MQLMPIAARISLKQTFLYLLFFDVVIVLLHLFLGNVSTFFHLDFEHNLPTVYQALKLLTAGYLIGFGVLEVYEKFTARQRLLVSPLAGLFIFLGIDELGLLHEQLDHYIREVFPEFADFVLWQAQQVGYFSSTWMVYYLPLILVFAGYGLYLLWYLFQNKSRLILHLLVFASLLLMTLCFEFIANQNQVSHDRYFLYSLMEETAELVGISVGLLFGLRLFRSFLKKPSN